MSTVHDSALGRDTHYPQQYDAGLLFPIARAQGRAALAIDNDPLPFVGADRWNAYELGWLDGRGKPVVAVASLSVPATSPMLIESKSLKLYLNSLNASRFDDHAQLLERIRDDLSQAAGAEVEISFGLPALDADDSADGDMVNLDVLDIECSEYAHPNPALLLASPEDVVAESLCSALMKSNCPVTGQPDWASVRIGYRGPRIDHAGLLRYLVSFREHAEFHEQCVERIFIDLMARCRPQSLSVEARYTRRGGLDINPWRTTPGLDAPRAGRDLRQ